MFKTKILQRVQKTHLNLELHSKDIVLKKSIGSKGTLAARSGGITSESSTEEETKAEIDAGELQSDIISEYVSVSVTEQEEEDTSITLRLRGLIVDTFVILSEIHSSELIIEYLLCRWT